MPTRKKHVSLKKVSGKIRRGTSDRDMGAIARRRARKMKKLGVYHKRRTAERKARR